MENSVPFVIKDIAINDIVFPPIEMRSNVSFEGLDELARSIRQVGLINPISVRPLGDKFELIAGFRRLKASEIVGKQAIACIIINSNDDISELQKAHENLFREEVNPLDEGKYFKTLIAKHDWKLADMAAMLHKSQSYVSRRITLTESDPVIAEAVQDGQINLSVAEELNKITSDTSRKFYLGHCINHGATVDIVRSWRVQANMDSSQPSEKEIIHLDPVTNEPITDPQVLQKLQDDTGPIMELTETVREFRYCTGCSGKTEAKEIFTAHFCPQCREVFEKSLKGE